VRGYVSYLLQGRDKGETDTKGGSKTRIFSGIFWKEDQQWSDDKLYGPI